MSNTSRSLAENALSFMAPTAARMSAVDILNCERRMAAVCTRRKSSSVTGAVTGFLEGVVAADPGRFSLSCVVAVEAVLRSPDRACVA